MRYLVTGVSGFIGSYLKEKLILTGHEVVGISRRENPDFDSSSYTHISVDLSDKNIYLPLIISLHPNLTGILCCTKINIFLIFTFKILVLHTFK